MRICVCYICVTNGPITEDYAARFVTTYNEYPPGIDHDTLVICNGGPADTKTCVLFSGMNAMMLPRSNEAWDIGGYVEASKGPCSGYDAMMCCGESVYFHREGWLRRMAEAWGKHGDGMYGPFASNLVRPHLNTTAFFVDPKLLAIYPRPVKDRYEFEHGENSFWKWVMVIRQRPVRLVTWDGEWEPRSWRFPHDILWRGNQRNCLMWCNHTDRYFKESVAVKTRWSRGADRPFK